MQNLIGEHQNAESHGVEWLVDKSVVDAKEVHGGALLRKETKRAEEESLGQNFNSRAQP
jgi:hypothetical protein